MKRLVVALAAVAALSACKPKEQWFESDVEVTRLDVRKDQKGTPVTSDVEILYASCPGKQYEVIRGGAEFAACMAAHKTGDKMRAKIRWFNGGAGASKSEIHQLGECQRPPDAEDEANYQTVRECGEWRMNGVVVGFRCKYAEKEKLTAACPWFARQ